MRTRRVVSKDAPRGVFRGVNFITPNVECHFKLKEGWAELSSGTGIEGEPIFGVTVRKGDGQHFEPDRSKLFHSRTLALGYIRELSRWARWDGTSA